MTLGQQIASNVVDSKLTSLLGLGLIVAGILCDSGVFGLYLSVAAEHAWCIAVGKMSAYVGGGALIVSRSPWSTPR